MALIAGVSFSAVAPENATGYFTKIDQRIPVKIVFAINNAHETLLNTLRVGMVVDVSLNTLDGWKTTQPSAAPNAAQLNVTSISVEAVTAPIGTLLPPEHSRQVS